MFYKEVIDYFGGKQVEVARTLGITRGAVFLWGRRGERVPENAALLLDRITGGNLKYNPQDYGRKIKKRNKKKK